MASKKPNMTMHPFVRQWMKKQGLIEGDTGTEVGYVAKLPNNFFPDSFMYSFENIDQDLAKINQIFGTSFDGEFLEMRERGSRSLYQIILDSQNVGKSLKVIPEKISVKNTLIYIGGITLPKRGFLYVESHKMDREIKERYLPGDFRPGPVKCIDFIPIDKRYFI